jgi:Family of unknown function (DUF6084)
MPDLDFRVESAAPVPYAATPLMGFRLAVTSSNAQAIHSVALRAQIRIEVTRRNYSADEQAHLRDLFGEPAGWGQTLRNMLWTNAGAAIPPFTGTTSVELQVPCTFDFNVAATKYFYGLESGEIPLCFLFSGTVFYDGGSGPQVAPISWSKEAQFRLPAETWRALMDVYYPNTAWLCLRRDVFERLYQYKVRNGIATWEQAIERILTETEVVA